MFINLWFIIRIMILIYFLTVLLPFHKMNPMFYPKQTITINKNMR